MQNDKKQNPPKTADAPQGELMKCPECGNDTFAMGKSVISDKQRYWRVPVLIAGKEEPGLRVEDNDHGGGYDGLHIVCRKCDTTFWENEILEMWKVGGWAD